MFGSMGIYTIKKLLRTTIEQYLTRPMSSSQNKIKSFFEHYSYCKLCCVCSSFNTILDE